MSPENTHDLLEHITPNGGVRVDIVSTDKIARSIERLANRFTPRVSAGQELAARGRTAIEIVRAGRAAGGVNLAPGQDTTTTSVVALVNQGQE